jgi:excisionase family DNA binding protein
MSFEANLQDPDADRLISINEAATRLGVSRRTVWRMMADEQLTPCHIRGCTRLSLAQVLSYLKGNGDIRI